MTTTARLTAAFAAIVVSLVLFQGVASLAHDASHAATQRLADVAGTTAAR
jgi:hypothetical protein